MLRKSVFEGIPAILGRAQARYCSRQPPAISAAFQRKPVYLMPMLRGQFRMLNTQVTAAIQTELIAQPPILEFSKQPAVENDDDDLWALSECTLMEDAVAAARVRLTYDAYPKFLPFDGAPLLFKPAPFQFEDLQKHEYFHFLNLGETTALQEALERRADPMLYIPVRMRDGTFSKPPIHAGRVALLRRCALILGFDEKALNLPPHKPGRVALLGHGAVSTLTHSTVGLKWYGSNGGSSLGTVVYGDEENTETPEHFLKTRHEQMQRDRESKALIKVKMAKMEALVAAYREERRARKRCPTGLPF